MKQKGLALGGFNPHSGRQSVYFLNPLDNNPDPMFCLSRRVDMDRALEEHCGFFQALNGCVICFDAIPKSTSKGSFIHRTKLKRTRIKELELRVCRSPETRTPRPGKEIRVTLMVWLSGLKTFSVTQTQETNWTIPLIPETPRLQENGTFEEDEKTDDSLCAMWENKHHRHHLLSMRRQKNLTEGREAHATLETIATENT